MKNFFIKIGCYIACNIWWPIWSSIRWKKHKEDVEVKEEDKVKTVSDIRELVAKFYDAFNYTEDGWDQLFDSICPPPYNYSRYLAGELNDDCDGFHSLVYHCLRKSGIECYLLSVIAQGSSHCVLLFKLENKWYVNDYTTVYDAFASEDPEEVIQGYNGIYHIIYNTKSEVLFNSLVEWDYEKQVFVSKGVKALTK